MRNSVALLFAVIVIAGLVVVGAGLASAKPACAGGVNQKAVCYARQVVGDACVWDGKGSTKDCARFTYDAYRKAGLEREGYQGAAAEYQYGVKRNWVVPKTQLKPGDLLFFEPEGGVVGGAAIYLGDKTMIMATGGMTADGGKSARSGTIKITQLGAAYLKRMKSSGIRPVLKPKNTPTQPRVVLPVASPDNPGDSDTPPDGETTTDGCDVVDDNGDGTTTDDNGDGSTTDDNGDGSTTDDNGDGSTTDDKGDGTGGDDSADDSGDGTDETTTDNSGDETGGDENGGADGAVDDSGDGNDKTAGDGSAGDSGDGGGDGGAIDDETTDSCQTDDTSEDGNGDDDTAADDCVDTDNVGPRVVIVDPKDVSDKPGQIEPGNATKDSPGSSNGEQCDRP
jgi:hypothetical protein